MTSEGVYALELLHAPAWLDVFKRVDDPRDLYSLCNTCTTFKNLLEPEKWRWGIPLILPHLAPYLTTKRAHLIHTRSPIPYTVTSRLTIQDWNGLLNYRFVGSDWCKAVDEFLSESPWDLRSSSHKNRLRLIHNFTTVQAFEDFQQRFGTWDRSPFPSKSVGFASFWGTNMDDYYPRMLQTVEDFGIHLKTLLLCPSTLFKESSVENCEIVWKLLSHLPNLKALTLPGPINLPEDREEVEVLEEEDVANYLAQHPLPPIPLEELELCTHVHRFSHFFLHRYGPQLKSLSTLTLADDDPKSLLLGGSTQLTQLGLCLFPESNLDYLLQLHSPLKKLDLSLSSTQFLTDRFLQAIQHLPIEELRITIHTHSELTFFTNSENLAVANYENNTIRFFALICGGSHARISFNFLQALKTVQVIKLSLQGGFGYLPLHPEGTPENIRLYQYFYRTGFEGDPFTKMYESNIWEIVPSLNSLNVHGRSAESIGRLGVGGGRNFRQASFNAWYSRNVYEQLNQIQL